MPFKTGQLVRIIANDDALENYGVGFREMGAYKANIYSIVDIQNSEPFEMRLNTQDFGASTNYWFLPEHIEEAIPTSKKPKGKTTKLVAEPTLEFVQQSDSKFVYENYYLGNYDLKIKNYYSFLNNPSTAKTTKTTAFKNKLKQLFYGSSGPSVSNVDDAKACVVRYLQNREELDLLYKEIVDQNTFMLKIKQYNTVFFENQSSILPVYLIRMTRMLFTQVEDATLLKYEQSIQEYLQLMYSLIQLKAKDGPIEDMQVSYVELIKAEQLVQKIKSSLTDIYTTDAKKLRLKKHQEEIYAKLVKVQPLRENRPIYLQSLQDLQETILVEDIPRLYKNLKTLFFDNKRIKNVQQNNKQTVSKKESLSWQYIDVSESRQTTTYYNEPTF